mmetsp:Transcript_4749/g.13290  ORF Transcript_4749/g.13290 Transcript_4749/m.13290 type:complete len:370 (-) Transcript_4749:215-1324(-)
MQGLPPLQLRKGELGAPARRRSTARRVGGCVHARGQTIVERIEDERNDVEILAHVQQGFPLAIGEGEFKRIRGQAHILRFETPTQTGQFAPTVHPLNSHVVATARFDGRTQRARHEPRRIQRRTAHLKQFHRGRAQGFHRIVQLLRQAAGWDTGPPRGLRHGFHHDRFRQEVGRCLVEATFQNPFGRQFLAAQRRPVRRRRFHRQNTAFQQLFVRQLQIARHKFSLLDHAFGQFTGGHKVALFVAPGPCRSNETIANVQFIFVVVFGLKIDNGHVVLAVVVVVFFFVLRVFVLATLGASHGSFRFEFGQLVQIQIDEGFIVGWQSSGCSLVGVVLFLFALDLTAPTNELGNLIVLVWVVVVVLGSRGLL